MATGALRHEAPKWRLMRGVPADGFQARSSGTTRTVMADPERSTSGAYDEAAKPIANNWQDVFLIQNASEDGCTGPASARCFYLSS